MSGRTILLLTYPTAVLAVLFIAARGWRLMRTTGLEQVEASYLPQDSDGSRPGPMLRLIDSVSYTHLTLPTKRIV